MGANDGCAQLPPLFVSTHEGPLRRTSRQGLGPSVLANNRSDQSLEATTRYRPPPAGFVSNKNLYLSLHIYVYMHIYKHSKIKDELLTRP